MKTCTKSKIFVHSTHDIHGPKGELEELFVTLPEPKKLVWVEAEDHFFKGALDPFETEIVNLGLSQ